VSSQKKIQQHLLYYQPLEPYLNFNFSRVIYQFAREATPRRVPAVSNRLTKRKEIIILIIATSKLQ
jgi:hypothetical protein